MGRNDLVRTASVVAILMLAGTGIGSAGNCEKHVPITTTSPVALKKFMIGRDLIEKLRERDSLPYFERAVQLDPGFAMGFLYLSFLQPSAEANRINLEVAATLAESVSEPERLWILGIKAGADGFPLKQQGYFKKLAALCPADERVHTQLGNTYFGVGDFEHAIPQYEKALKLNPDYSPPYNQLGYAYSHMEKFDAAEKAFKKYIALIPDDPNPYDSYAELLLKMGRYDESIETYRKALEVNPGFVASYMGIAANLNYKGQHAEARRQLQKMYDVAHDDAERRIAHFATAVSYLDEGNTARGLEELMKRYALAEMIDDTASMAEDLVLIGTVLLEIGKYDEAAAWYSKAGKLVVESDLPPGRKDNAKRMYLFNAARVDLRKGEVAAAAEMSKEFTTLVEAARNPYQIPLAHQLAGMVALEQGDYDGAIAELEQANTKSPYNMYRLARAYEGRGDDEKAGALCERAATFKGVNSLSYAFSKSKARNLLASISARRQLERKALKTDP